MKIQVFVNAEVKSVKKAKDSSLQNVVLIYDNKEFNFIYYSNEVLKTGKYAVTVVKDVNTIELITNDEMCFGLVTGNIKDEPELKELSNGNEVLKYSVSSKGSVKNAEGKYPYIYTNVSHFQTNLLQYLTPKKPVTLLFTTKFNNYNDKIYANDTVKALSFVYVDEDNQKNKKDEY